MFRTPYKIETSSLLPCVTNKKDSTCGQLKALNFDNFFHVLEVNLYLYRNVNIKYCEVKQAGIGAAQHIISALISQ